MNAAWVYVCVTCLSPVRAICVDALTQRQLCGSAAGTSCVVPPLAYVASGLQIYTQKHSLKQGRAQYIGLTVKLGAQTEHYLQLHNDLNWNKHLGTNVYGAFMYCITKVYDTLTFDTLIH